MTEIQETIGVHPDLKQWLVNPLSTRRLGGLTNKNYLVETTSGKFVLRVPGKGTQEYIRRDWEGHAARITADIGVNATVLYFDEKTGVQLCGFIESAVTMDADRFKDPGSIARAARSLKRVHESKRPFQNTFELFSMIDQYLEFLRSKGARLPDGFIEIQKEAEGVRGALHRSRVPTLPCHCDPLAENFLDTGDRMYIVDWEYSGMNDPMWDLGDLSVEAGFSPEQDETLLSSYFGTQGVSDFDRGRMVLCKAMCDLLWTLWGIIQHTNQNPTDDFWTYSVNRLNRCTRLMGCGTFGEHLRAVSDWEASL